MVKSYLDCFICRFCIFGWWIPFILVFFSVLILFYRFFSDDGSDLGGFDVIFLKENGYYFNLIRPRIPQYSGVLVIRTSSQAEWNIRSKPWYNNPDAVAYRR